MTGVGLVSPLGMGTGANWDALSAGRAGLVRRSSTRRFSARIAGEVKDFDPLSSSDKKEIKKWTSSSGTGLRPPSSR